MFYDMLNETSQQPRDREKTWVVRYLDVLGLVQQPLRQRQHGGDVLFVRMFVHIHSTHMQERVSFFIDPRRGWCQGKSSSGQAGKYILVKWDAKHAHRRGCPPRRPRPVFVLRQSDVVVVMI
jgi:hypothetical protein